MHCPRDQGPLSIQDSQGKTGYACPSCKGTWLPARFVDAIRHTRPFSPENLMLQLAQATAGEASLRCPGGCGLLSVALISDVELDWCPSCKGIWFDGNELEKLLANFPRHGMSNKDLAAMSALDVISTALILFAGS